MCSFMRGAALGLMLGVCAGVSLGADKRRSKKMINRAVRSMNDMADRLADAIGI